MHSNIIIQDNGKTYSRNENNAALLEQELLYGSAPACVQESKQLVKTIVKSFLGARPRARGKLSIKSKASQGLLSGKHAGYSISSEELRKRVAGLNFMQDCFGKNC
jgi:hypothetical protein